MMEKGETSYGDLVTMEFYLAKIAQFHRGKNVDVRWGRLKKPFPFQETSSNLSSLESIQQRY